MDISLNSRSDILAWASVFRVLGYKLSIPIWKIVDIPQEIADEPNYMLEIAQLFFTREQGMLPKKKLTSEEEVANLFEAHRMVALGYLYNSFGRIVAYYREENAIKLYKWGERNFVHEKKICWSIWYSVFSNILKKGISLETSLAKNDLKKILEIIKNQFEQFTNREERLQMEFEEMCQKYASDPEERNLINNLLSYDLTVDTSFDTVCDELDFVFHFELLLAQDCAYKIWHIINTTFEIKVRKNLFVWGIDIYHSLDGSLDKNLEDYCLSA